MAVRDLEAFLRQSAAVFDPNLDTTPGSPFDNKVIQPLVRRLGTDPFSVDLQTFLVERMRQAYPMLATGEGDNITDLLIKPTTLLWDPVVRETTRVRRNLSFADPSTLTTDEADSLGGNFFVARRRGNFSRGTIRVFFSSPQQITITQNNFATSRGGLVFFPTSIQSIRSEEMLLNVSADGLYYFDVAVIASKAGLSYDVDPGEITAIANIPSATRVTNLSRFRGGLDEETPTEYAGRLQQSLGEKSLVALRGIAAKLLEGFPEVNRLNVVGYNDPEMQRDVITGGGAGPIIASGILGRAISDGGASAYTRRFFTSEANFDLLIGSGTGFILTVFNATSSTAAAVDVGVESVFDQNSIDLKESVLLLTAASIRWTLRRQELTLSGIPGGILFPNTANGELVIPSGTIHIGGAYDTYVREAGFDDATFTIQNVTDDDPALSGTGLTVTDITGGGLPGTALVLLGDLVLGSTYSAGDATDTLLYAAEYEGYALQIQNGPNAGTYRVLEYFEAAALGTSPSLRLEGTLAVNSSVTVRWRLFDDVNIDLVEPKETRIEGSDLVMTQGADVVSTSSGIDFSAFGVAKGDILRVLDGQNAGDYEIIADPLVPSYNNLRVDRTFAFSAADARYTIFRTGTDGLKPPFVRIRTVELLDSSAQPQGSFIPYAKPVDVQSRAFQNPARGVKHDFRDTRLGIVSAEASVGSNSYVVTSGSNTLTFYFPTLVVPEVTITIPAGTYNVAALVTAINALTYAATSNQFAEVAVQISDRRFGIRPVGNGFVAIVGGTARTLLLGGVDLRTTSDVRTDKADTRSGYWGELEPRIDADTGLDVLQVIDGRNVGFFAGPFTLQANSSPFPVFPDAEESRALIVGDSLFHAMSGDGTYYAPDAQRHVLIGARSLGSVRVYFLEPTSFEVGSDTVFSLDTGATGIARFIPDPTLSHQQIPSLPNGVTPSDGASAVGSSVFTSVSQDFLLSGINIGDKLYIDNHPIAGTVTHTGSYISGIAGSTLVYSVDNGPDRTLVFVRDDPSVPTTAVTKTGVLEQINASVGLDIASYDASEHLVFTTDLAFVVRAQGTANNTLLGNVLNYAGPKAYSSSDTSNTSPHSLESGYTITDVGQTTLQVLPSVDSLDPNWPGSVTAQTFRVERAGVQRVSTTQMAEQVAEAGLYYADVELVSEGTGDFWNIDSGLQLTVAGYKSDGYYVETQDSNLTFSTVEAPRLVISRTILEQGVDDDPRNATQITGQSLQVTYDRSELVNSVQDFIGSETERVVCSSPLSHHLIPHFVRFDMEYFGGSEESVVMADVEKYVREIYPTEGLDASDVQKLASDRGATKVTNPLTLIAVVHNMDRSIYIQRSQDSLSTGRLSAFFPDKITVKRNISGGSL